MSNLIKLSICIPTYNRAHTLLHLLSSIEREIQNGNFHRYVEVVISDNASTDNTSELVESFFGRIQNVNYIQLDRNKGFGINITNAVNHAQGEYCWLMGSDEVLCDGVLAKLIDIIDSESGSDIILGNAITKGVERKFFIDTIKFSKTYSAKNIASFIHNCTELSSCFAFISTVIIKKRYLDNDFFPDNYISHPYTHLLRIFFILKNTSCSIRLLGWPLVDTGFEGNEWNAVVFNHFKLDYHTVYTICHEIYFDAPEIVDAFLSLLRRQYSPFQVIVSRACASQQQWNEIMPVLSYFDVPDFLCRKTFCDTSIKFGYKILKKARGIFRNVKI